MRRGLALLLLVLASASTPRGAVSQARSDTASVDGVRVTGQVVDRVTGDELPAALLFLTALDGSGQLAWQGSTGASGTFEAAGVPRGAYELRAEALGYEELTEVVALLGAAEIHVRVELVPAAIIMDGLVITSLRQSRLERAGFYERRSLGTGHTRTREEIEARNPARASDVFRTIPGVQVVQRGGGLGGMLVFRGGCRPELVIDGVAVRGDFTIDELLTAQDLEAVEVYSAAATPARFARSDRTTCGTVLAWTRDGSGTEGSPMTLRRLLTAGVLVGLAVLLQGI